MLTAVCAAVAIVTLAVSMLFAYFLGRLKTIRGTEAYKTGFTAGQRHSEYERNALLERIVDLKEQRDRWKDAVDEAYAQYATLAAQAGHVDGAYEEAREVTS